MTKNKKDTLIIIALKGLTKQKKKLVYKNNCKYKKLEL